jgi:hypothetical protein
MPEAIREMEEVLDGLTITAEELVRGGGGEGDMTQRLRRELSTRFGWRKHNFTVTKLVDGVGEEKGSGLNGTGVSSKLLLRNGFGSDCEAIS